MAHVQNFIVEPQQVLEDVFILRGSELRHAALVCRKKKGDWLSAVDGRGNLYGGVISLISDMELQVEIREHITGWGEPRFKLTLAQALLKGEHFDWVVEKGSEIGVTVFQPMWNDFSVAKSSSRSHRWQEKARAAMKQCGRSYCPDIRPVKSFTDILSDNNSQLLILAHNLGDTSSDDLQSLVRSADQAVVIVGPEGGFTDEEVELAVKAGTRFLSLGQRRLRSETAAIVVAARILTLAGDLG